jgi:hypothetical protein
MARRLSARQVQALIKLAGGNRALARVAGVSPGSVSKWRYEGVSAEYGKRISKAVLQNRIELQESKNERLEELEGRLTRLESERNYERDRADSLQRAIESMRAESAPRLTFAQIIQVYRDIGRAPDLDEAMGMADDFDYEINEVYDAYYEESE